MYKSKIFTILIAISSFTLIGQNNVWHIGSSMFFSENEWQKSSFKLDFTSGVPIASSDGGSLSYYESVSVVTDQYGNERMYSDGIKIMDASHVLMYGAPETLQGTGSGATASSTQGALSITDRENTDIIHFFTANSIDGNQSGLRYHRVDLSKSGNGTLNDPLGEVIVFDSLLHANTAEMITSYGSCESDSVWIIAHEANSYDFIKILLTSRVKSVTSQTVPTPTANDGLNFTTAEGRGSIDFNPEGTEIAVTGTGIGTHILDFNKRTGILSNPKEVLGARLGMSSVSYSGYGTEFSPDGSKLYVSNLLSHEILQYDLKEDTSYIWENISSPASLERGPDGNIYVAKASQNSSTSLGKISNPNNSIGDLENSAVYNGDAIVFPTSGNVSYALPQDNICYNTIITSNKKNKITKEANIYPNPAKDYVFNRLGEKFVFYNTLGAEIFKSNEIKINISNLVDGVYFVKSQGAVTRLVVSK